MFNFFQKASTELDHVVWPTPNETKKFMNYTVGTIVVLAILLAVLGYGLRYALSETRNVFPHAPATTVSGEDDYATQEDLDKILDTVAKKKALSGSTATGQELQIDTGATETSTGQ